MISLKTKFRIRPGCIGNYPILDKAHAVAEIEEIIIGSNTMSNDDYVDCRVMNLIIETFFNNFMFEEIFAMLKPIGISPLDSLIYLKNHSELHGKKFITTINDFIKETNNLFDTWEEANSYMKSDGVIDKYNKGEIGHNELLFYSAQLFNEFEEICNLIFKSVEESLKEKGLITEEIQNYLSELKRFMFMMKKDLLVDTESVKSANFNYDFQKIQKASPPHQDPYDQIYQTS